MRWHIPATRFDRRVAAAIARRASPELERPAKIVTLVADERAMLLFVAGLWLVSRHGNGPATARGQSSRRQSARALAASK